MHIQPVDCMQSTPFRELHAGAAIPGRKQLSNQLVRFGIDISASLNRATQKKGDSLRVALTYLFLYFQRFNRLVLADNISHVASHQSDQ